MIREWFIAAALLLAPWPAAAQAAGGAAGHAAAASVADSFVVAGGVRLHYLDFGGVGLPIVFVHSEAWDAHTYAEFAPRFADRNRVLAVTRPGYGASEPHADGFGVKVQARSLIDFLDALQIERAVFAGNASATAELTSLGEHHADRVAGLIYFTGLAVPWLEERDADPTRAFEMFRRASPGAGDVAERVRARKAYRPELLRADRPTIPVPALAFVARSGTKGNERAIGALALVGSPLMADVRNQMPPSPVRDHLERLASDERYRARQLEQIEDPEARAYFLRLAADPEDRLDTLALTNVTLIDGTGAPPRPRMTVLVYGDRIGGVFPADEAAIPASAVVLDLSGQYVIPGLINTHVHLPMLGWTRDSVATGLERMLHAGVTTVREMAGDTRLSAELERAALVEGASLPNIHYAVRMADPAFYEPVRATNRAWIGYAAGTAPWAQAVTAETDVARAVAMAAGTGAAGLKLYTGLDADVVRRLVAEAHRQGLKAWAHGTVFPAGPLEAVRAGIDGLSHVCFLFFGLQPVVAASMAERVPFDPDLVDLGGGLFQELMREMRVRDVVLDATARNASRNPGPRSFGCTPELLNRSLRAAHRAGVRISTGTDYVISDGDPDPTLFTEIEYLVGAGVLSPLGAITAATLNGAHAIGIEEEYGTIEVGKVADLVVLSSDPTEDIGALQGVVAVFKGGRQVSRR